MFITRKNSYILTYKCVYKKQNNQLFTLFSHQKFFRKYIPYQNLTDSKNSEILKYFFVLHISILADFLYWNFNSIQ